MGCVSLMGTMELNNNKNEIINTFKDKGYFFPIDLFSNSQSSYYKKYIDSVAQIKASSLKFEHKFKSHLIFKWVNDLMRDDRILSIVKPILGNDILCWNSIFFYKPKNTEYFVGWHEDKTYWKLKNNNIVTVSIALSDSNPENGCLKIIKEKVSNLSYSTKQPKFNMLARGQNAIIDNNSEFEHVTLKAGQCAIFGQEIVHGSGPNKSNNDRLLLAFRYITPENFTDMNHKSASIVSGEDKYNLYEKEPIPNKNFQKNCLEFHQKLMGKQAKVFGEDKLSKFKLSFLSPLLKSSVVRGFYYNYFK